MYFFKIEISLYFGVPDKNISLHFGVPKNQMSLHLEVPNNWSLKSYGGVRQIKSLANGSTPQTEEHWASLHKLRSTTLLYCTLYTVHCTLFTVHLPPHNFSTQLSKLFASPFFDIIFPHNIST